MAKSGTQIGVGTLFGDEAAGLAYDSMGKGVSGMGNLAKNTVELGKDIASGEDVGDAFVEYG